MKHQGPYRVILAKSAARDYEKITNHKLLRGINRVLDALKTDPFQYKTLAGPFKNFRSARTFSFRIIYEVRNRELVVHVIAIDHRRDVYR